MRISVESRAHRTLRGLEPFKSCDRLDQLPQLNGIHSPLDDSERLVGVYENVVGRVDHILLFTNLGVHLWEGSRWRSLKYADIASTEWPTEPKHQARTLVVRMKSRAYEHLPILRGCLFDVMRFFDRVVGDLK
jgi:hypothetical protein